MNNKTNQFITSLLTKFLYGYSVFILSGFVVSTIIVEAQENNHNVLTLERIYKDSEFSLKRFGPTRWLEDGSGHHLLAGHSYVAWKSIVWDDCEGNSVPAQISTAGEERGEYIYKYIRPN